LGTLVNNDKYPLLLLGLLTIFGSATQGSVADEGSKRTAAGNWMNADASSGELPAGFKVERYTGLWERSPFAPPSDAAPETRHSALENLYLIGWLSEGSKELIYVQNSQTNEVQRITTRPNDNNLRLVGMHLNSNPLLVDAVVAADQEQGTVKFRLDMQVADEIRSPVLAKNQANPSIGQVPVPSNTTSRFYPGIPRVRSEGGHPLHEKRSKFAPKVSGSVPGQS
jgi:hypothetical protein